MIKQKPVPLKLRYRDDRHMEEIINNLAKSEKVTNIQVADDYVTYEQVTYEDCND